MFALADRGIGESLTLDYEEKLSGKRRDLAADVCALANTQGGVLVVGVKDPKPEGSPPKYPEDFVGVPVEEDLVHRVESRLLDAISPRVFQEIKTTDTFTRGGEERCFLLIRVPASPELHQVTVERDFKHYRRAEYQNRPMSSDEIRRRVEGILATQRGISALFDKEISRLEDLMAGPYTAFLAAPTVGHRLAVDPADPAIRSELTGLGRRGVHPETEGLLVNAAEFRPVGDGARSVVLLLIYRVFMECRVRRDSLISHGQSHNAVGPEPFLVERHSSADELWREEEDPERTHTAPTHENMRWQSASTTMQTAQAVELRPIVLRRKVTGFLEFVHQVYELGGWRGAIRFDLQLVGLDAFPAVCEFGKSAIPFLRLSEAATLRTTAQLKPRRKKSGTHSGTKAGRWRAPVGYFLVR